MQSLIACKAIDLVPIATLTKNPRNARVHSESQIAQLMHSMQQFGFTIPLLIDEHNMIIAGHGRMEALKRLNQPTAPVIRLSHLSEAEKRAYILADNQIPMLAEWDESLLRDELVLLRDDDFDLSLIGFDDEMLHDLFTDDENAYAGQTDDDAVPEINQETAPTAQRGDIWILGKHRLMCGDSTKKEDVEKLMRGASVDMVFTDPPYNVDYCPENRPVGGRSRSKKKLGKIANDSMDDGSFYEFLKLINSSILCAGKNGASIYQCAPTGMNNLQYLMAWRDAGFHYSDGLVWMKNNHSISRKDYHPKHEIIHYGWIQGAHKWYGDRNKFSVFQCSRENVHDYQHPTQKPVQLSQHFIENSSTLDAPVLDLFGGSGSTLIACEKTHRKCFMMEIDPKYCDVIIARWEQFTGETARRAETVD